LSTPRADRVSRAGSAPAASTPTSAPPLFAHYEGVRGRPASRRGDILLPVAEGVWYWIIPFSDGTASVGAVFDPAIAGGAEGETLEQRFDRLIVRNAKMIELLSGGRRTSKVHGISDYSAASAKLRGDGYVLVGDAATFLDPVFSTGVFLAMATGLRAARAIDRAIARHGRVDARDLKAYEKDANKPSRASGVSCTPSTARSSSRRSARRPRTSPCARPSPACSPGASRRPRSAPGSG
jgi:hypothetical protein